MSDLENIGLYMSKAKFMEIMNDYIKRPAFVGMDSSDLEDIFYMVYDLLKAEEEALREEEPWATATIRKLSAAATTVNMNVTEFCDAFNECYPE